MSRRDDLRLADMRDRLVHSHCDTAVAIIEVTVATELDELEAAVKRLADGSGESH